jgi:omega-6 fatty acid desaturase (delta-12 desaturase)
MGKGGRASVPVTDPIQSSSSKDGHWVSPYNPLDPKAPKLPSKGEIKAVIPKACFERSYVHSMYFVARDTAWAAGCAYIAYQTLSTDVPSNLLSMDALTWFLGWNTYAFWMGCILTGHWVLAHECGHGAFSPSQTFNDIWGFIMHQALLVPYFAWQYTHAKHHRRTNNTVDGESHVPNTRDEMGVDEKLERHSGYAVIHEAMGDGPFAMFQIFAHLVIGWPLYLMGLASTGRLGQDGKKLDDGDIIDHYRPWSKMFPAKLKLKITLSTLGVIAAWVGIYKACVEYGTLPVTLWYIGPLMWNQAWLVLYTWLQHNDPSVPQYGADQWTWVKGALSTIDRPYGIFDFFHHKIGSTHVAHHLFHEMPFYKADVATAAIKAYLEPMGLYNYDPTPWYLAMWRVAKTCHYIDGLEGVQYYKSLEDVPLSKNGKKID